MSKRLLASQFSSGNRLSWMHFPESLRMKSEFISCDFISPTPCGWKSEFQIQFRKIASSLHSTEFSLILFVCVINSRSSPAHLSISRKFSRANPRSAEFFTDEVINCEPSQISRIILGRSPRFCGPSAEEVSTFAISRKIIQSSSRATVWPWAWARGRGKSSEREGMMHLFVYFLMIFMM